MKTLVLIILLALPVPNLWAQDVLPKSQLRTADPLIQRIANLEELVYRLNKTLEQSLERDERFTDLPAFEPSFELGLGLGFHAFGNSPCKYTVGQDSQLLVYGGKAGLTSMLNGIVAYRINPISSIYMNVPLVELTGKRQNSFGILAGNLIIGFGYIHHLNAVSFYGALNIQPYQVIAPEVLRTRKIDQSPFSSVDVASLPTYTAYSPSLSLGAAFKLWASQNQSYGLN